MADTKISALTAASTPDLTEVTPIVQGGVTKKMTLSQLDGVRHTFTVNQVISVADNANAALRITQTGTGNALLVEDSANPDSSPFVVNTAGQLILGHTSAVTTNGISAWHQQHGQGESGSTKSLSRWQNGTAGQLLLLNHSRSATIGSYSVLSANDDIGEIRFNGDDGTAFITGASLSAKVDGTPGTNDMPGRLVFSTTADGASSPTERLRINASGNVLIGATTDTVGKLQVNGSISILPGTSVVPTTNGQVTFELTNNTTLTIRAKGSDGTVRSGTITLA